MKTYTSHLNTRQTPQSEQIPGSDQERNSAGGHVYVLDHWDRLDRFLILGTEGGTYYVGERALTLDAADSVRDCIREDGERVVSRIVEISEAGRAPRQDPAIFALAMVLKTGSIDARRAAVAAVPKVCRIGTHLYMLAEAVQALGGWGRLTRKAFAT